MTVPAIGLRTPLATPRGMVAACALREGDIVLTRDHGACPIRRILRRDLPGQGPLAPVLLRAPYFGLATDCIVSGSQQIALAGVEVEYLFGVDEVVTEARALIDGHRARLVPRAATLGWVSLDLGIESLLLSGLCPLAVAPFEAGRPRAATRFRQIDMHETRALQAMRLRGQTQAAA